MTAGLVGLRAGELCGILWQDIDSKKEIVKDHRHSRWLEEGAVQEVAFSDSLFVYVEAVV